MEIGEESVVLEPVSPTGQYLSSSFLSLSIIAVLESEIPIDDFQAFSLVRDVFLPINPRFSSIMVVNRKGEKQWKKVEVKLKDHIKLPIFSTENSTKFYDDSLNEYISTIIMEKFPENQPLWEMLIIKYPTKQAAGNIIFKLHHSFGDGFSLMGALLSCLKRADNPSIPLTFPTAQIHSINSQNSIFNVVPKILSSMYYTISDFWSAIAVRSGLVEDDISPIRSGHSGVEFLPTSIVTMSFSLDSVKQIKAKLGVTINDVVMGTIFLGTRLYMEAMGKGSGKARATSLVMLNTRMFRGYKPVGEMLKPNAKLPWGNHFTFLSVSIPSLNGSEVNDPLQFVRKAREIIQSKRSSVVIFLTSKYLQLVRKFKGSEVVSKYLHGSLKNTSLVTSNIMGPTEQMAFANHPIIGFYFLIAGPPQSLVIGVTSYMGKLRVSAMVENDFIDPDKFKLYVENAFDLIFAAACGAFPSNSLNVHS
ncbi:wax ester synthase/diacylglycerol acyltransferase 4-like [Euphorbia lathyris]|uniref:wax ester synthase/diacylglycerol acyltransferase 4-like n=1 Tax=Euphorbia lathyris TaxID=212925 RepID=UPI0033132A1E